MSHLAPVAPARTQIERARQALADQPPDGLTVRELAALADVSYGTAWRAINPRRVREYERRARKRKNDWENRHRARCASCRRPLAAGTGRANGTISRRAKTGLCRDCLDAQAASRMLALMRMRYAAVPIREIARLTRRSPNSVYGELSRLRAAGFDVPKSPTGIRVESYAQNARVANMRDTLARHGVTPGNLPAHLEQRAAL